MFTKQKNRLKVGTATLDYTIIPWDSEYLKNTTVEIEHVSSQSSTLLQKLIAQLQRKQKLKNNDLLFTKIPLEHFEKIHMLHQSGFYWVEQTITLSINLSSWKPEDFTFENGDHYKLVLAKTSDRAAIRKIAQTTFTTDRYHLDPNIPKSKADYRFEMWIENSFKGSDTVYKFVDTYGTIVGFFIINDKTSPVELRLAGLDPQHIGRGLGKMLYHHMYELLKKKGHAATQAIISFNNLPVMNVYMYLGHAKFIAPLIVFHKVL